MLMGRIARLLLATLLLLAAACGNVELPDEADTGEKGETPVSPVGDTLSVADFRSMAEDGVVYWVKGYIVGYAGSTSLSSAVFGRPDEGANTNMLLADDPDETDYACCLPVKLTTNGDGNSFRARLNLYDHPEYYKRRIALLGQAGEYFRVTGVVTLYEYKWCGAADDVSESPWPELDDSLQYVPGGR